MMDTKVVTITVDSKFCKGCNLCIEVCPRDVLSVSKERGAAGSLIVEATKPEACTSCMMCELICPDFAIVVNGR
jgi:2-oxoglutarate ferredoxin oxidoreductase subunit delta